jgi:hypothetical protein
MTGWPPVRTSDSAMCSRQIGVYGQLSIGFDQTPSIQQRQQPGARSGMALLTA